MSRQRKPPSSPPVEIIEFLPNGGMRCRAITALGWQCKRPVVQGSYHCALHGPKVMMTNPPNQRKLPKTRSGYLKWMPVSIAQRYEEILNDEDFIGLRNEIALLRTNLSELIEEVDQGDSPKTWSALLVKWSSFMDAIRNGDSDRQQRLLYELDDLIREAPNRFEKWEQIGDVSEKIRKLVLTEVQIEEKRETLMSVEKVLALIAMLLREWTSTIYRFADDEAAKKIIVEVDARSRQIVGS